VKFRTLNKWSDLSDLQPLLYFAQLLDELLFDYSLDTYKPSAMNTSLLVAEGLSVISAVEDGIIDKANLAHIMDELSENLKRDPVADELLTLDLNLSLKVLKN